MFHYLCFVVLLNFAILQTFAFIQIPPCNENDTSVELLDTAMNVIAKAKENLRFCPGRASPPFSISKPIDCEEVLRSGQTKTGIYTIWPRSRVSDNKPLPVYCDMYTDGGGWTVIQRRGDYGKARDYFFKDWASYKTGFGDIGRDFWLGNDNIFALTNQRPNSIRFDLKDFQHVFGETRFAHYNTFWIDDEDRMYKLHIKGFSGNAGDSLASYHDNAMFSTKDKDNDNHNLKNCALAFKGAWWYNACHISNLNGLYGKGLQGTAPDGIHWQSWKYNVSLEFTEIKIRPSNFNRQRAPRDH